MCRRTVPALTSGQPCHVRACVPSSPELRSGTPRVGTHEAVTVATPPFPSGEVTPGFEPCPPQNVDVCPACLGLVVAEGAGPATACRWPVCGHSHHALCLARSRAHVQRTQCALCRQGWRPAFDSDLEALCGQLGIDWHALHDPCLSSPRPLPVLLLMTLTLLWPLRPPSLMLFLPQLPLRLRILLSPRVGPHTCGPPCRGPSASGQQLVLRAAPSCRRRPAAPKCRTPMVSSSRSRRRLAGGCVSTPSFSAGASVSVPVCP